MSEHGRERADRSRRPDRALDAEPADAREDGRELLAHVRDERAHLGGGRRVRPEEALGRADHAERKALREQELTAVAHDDLGRTAADVEEQRAAFAEGERLARRPVRQRRLLVRREHAEVQPGRAPDALDEGRAVGRIADGARRRGDDGPGSGAEEPACDPAQGVHRGRRPDGVQRPVRARDEADPLLHAADLDEPTTLDPHEERMDRARAHVDRGDGVQTLHPGGT